MTTRHKELGVSVIWNNESGIPEFKFKSLFFQIFQMKRLIAKKSTTLLEWCLNSNVCLSKLLNSNVLKSKLYLQFKCWELQTWIQMSIQTFQWRVFTHVASIYANLYKQRKRFHKKRIQLPQDWFGAPTWLPFHCFGTPPRRDVMWKRSIGDSIGHFRVAWSLCFKARLGAKLLMSLIWKWLFILVPGGYPWEFLVGVCRPVLQILTLFRTKK